MLFLSTAPNGSVIKAYADMTLKVGILFFAFSAMHIRVSEHTVLTTVDDDWESFCSNSTGADENLVYQVCGSVYVPPSEQLATHVMLTFGVLGSSVLISLLSYLSIIFSKIDDQTHASKLEQWWRFYQWPMHLGLLLLLAGIIFYGLTMELTARIAFLDLANIDYGDESTAAFEIKATWIMFFMVAIAALYMLAAHIFVAQSSHAVHSVSTKAIDLEEGPSNPTINTAAVSLQ